MKRKRFEATLKMNSAFVELTNMERFQAALKIQRAWRQYWNTCPYCYTYGCGGVYSEFSCPEMWTEYEVAKLDAQIDRLHGRW